jgi:hypothetical protein
MRFKLTAILIALILVLSLVAGVSAATLLCVSNKELKGQETVGSCLAKGERFAVVDQYGLVRIWTPEEIALTKVLNPKVFQTGAFGMRYIQLAPPTPPAPAPAVCPGRLRRKAAAPQELRKPPLIAGAASWRVAT